VQTPLLQPAELAALSAVLSYWEGHWDWECPTLLGLELDEYRAAVATWRDTSDLAVPQVAFALRRYPTSTRAAFLLYYMREHARGLKAGSTISLDQMSQGA